MTPKLKEKLFKMVYTSESDYTVALSFDLDNENKNRLKTTYLTFMAILANLGLTEEYIEWSETKE